MLRHIAQSLLCTTLDSRVTVTTRKKILIGLGSLLVFYLCREISLKVGVATGSSIFINNSLSGDNPIAAVETYAKRSLDRKVITYRFAIHAMCTAGVMLRVKELIFSKQLAKCN
jgi:hypothetical protein